MTGFPLRAAVIVHRLLAQRRPWHAHCTVGAAAIVACDRELCEASETGDVIMFKRIKNRKQSATGPSMLRKTAVLWLAMLGLLATALPFGSGCDEEQIRELVADARDAAEDLDPWTKFCLLNTEAEDFAACEAGHVE